MPSLRFINDNFPDIQQWVSEQTSTQGTHQDLPQQGYSSKTYIYRNKNMKLVLKVPTRLPFLHNLSKKLLHNEFQIYEKLKGIKGIPKCYGFIDNEILVLEYITHNQFGKQPINNPHIFFHQLFLLITEVHKHGVCHGDLKRKNNILINNDESPYLIDFGTAIQYKKGFHPWNHFLFKLIKKTDINAYLKHKYHGNYNNFNLEDQKIYAPTIIEDGIRMIRTSYKRLLRGFKNF